MLYSLLCSVIILGTIVHAGIDDPDNDQSPGNCKDPCGAQKCNAWASPDHACAAREIMRGIAVDPFRCGEPRCEPTSCDKCGTKDDCVTRCRDYKIQLSRAGYDMGDGYPSCENVCGEFLPRGADDYMCFIDSCRPDKNEGTNKPECYDLYKCQESYCSAPGEQDCYAKYNYVDPWKVSMGDPCKQTNCRRCGGQDTCMDYCEDYKNNHPQEEQVNCKTECSAVSGYKCILTPGGAEPDKMFTDEDALRAETAMDVRSETDATRQRTSSSSSSSSSSVGYVWPLGLGVLASLALGEYWYRQHFADQSHKRIS